MAGIKVEVWKEYDITSVDDLAKALEESGEKYFRIYGEDRACYFDVGYTKETNTLFAYDMVVLDQSKTYTMGKLILTMMSFMNEHKMAYDHAIVCSEAEPVMKPFREQMYKSFPDVKRLNFS